MTRVLIADDHVLLLDGLAEALAAIPDLEVVGRAVNGRELVEMARELGPDVLLVDLEMPELGGLEALAALENAPPALVVTMHADSEHRLRAERQGVAGFLSKSEPLPELAAAIRAVAAGERLPTGEDLRRELLDRYREPRLDEGAAALTARERELLGLLASGVSATEELAERLYISQKTVKNHLASIYEKLAVSDRAQAAVEAIRLGLSRK